MKKTILNPQTNSLIYQLKEVYKYRELLWSLSIRDFKVKYAQTFIGFIWAILSPVLTLLILSFVFGRVIKVDVGQTPHLVFTMSGLVAWNYFSILVSEGGTSILNNQNMIKKIYFPKLVIPLSKALSGLIDFGINLMILLGLMLYFGIVPSSNIIFLPVFIIVSILLGLTGAVWISALNVRYRDFKFVIPFILQLGLYASPIAYAITNIPTKYQFLYNLNPMTGVIEGFRWCLLGTGNLSVTYLCLSVLYVVVFLIAGLFYFNKVEGVMADII